MREIMPRPVLLAVTLMLIVGAVVFIELRLDSPGADATSARANVEKQPKDAARARENRGQQGCFGRREEGRHRSYQRYRGIQTRKT